MPLGVLRKPAFEDPLLLEEHLVDGPEAGKRKAAQDGGDYGMPDKQGSAGAQKAHHQPHPPALFSPVVFHLDDGWMADAYAQEHGGSHNDSTKIHPLYN